LCLRLAYLNDRFTISKAIQSFFQLLEDDLAYDSLAFLVQLFLNLTTFQDLCVLNLKL
jgi:hypothetical protein